MRQIPINVGVIHFVGIGGIGMSGIANTLVNLGYKVSGSDIRENAMTVNLAKNGVSLKIGHDKQNVHGASVVVVSSAVQNDNAEISEARALGIPVVRRAEMLAELMKMKNSIAVAGTHGKTTTTSLIAAILDKAQMDPTVINGGIINAYNSNARLGLGDWIVVEADESDGSFTKLMSTIVVVTNIDFDHADNFKSFSELSDLFCKFIWNIPFYGTAVMCIDHGEVEKISKKIEYRKIITYGLSKKADVSCENIKLSKDGSKFDVVFSDDIVKKYKLEENKWQDFSLNLFGMHNIQNALAAISVGLELSISGNDMRTTFCSFLGIRRRFTIVADIKGVKIIDDYAHHPVEIDAVLKAAKTICSGKIFVVVQPHRYTRLHNLLYDFANVLEQSDYAFITPIYSAGEESNGIDHFSLLNLLNENKKNSAEFVKDLPDLVGKIRDMIYPKDFIIFLGAGDITKWAYEFAEALANIDM